jgi:HPt (histidine-containing phosphotransfer) domain-containing protein
MKIYEKYIKEVAYAGNLGFQEMVELYQKATKEEIEKVEKAIKNNDWKEFVKLVKKILGITLK